MGPNYRARLEALKTAWEAFKDQDFRGYSRDLFADTDRWIAAFEDEDVFIVVTKDDGEYITNWSDDEDSQTSQDA